MKKINSLAINGSFVIAVAMMLFYFTSCARKISFQPSPIVPAAEGAVKVKKDKNNNYDIQISFSHLAASEKLQPPRNTYVIWMETESNGTKNIGQINSSTGFLSNKLKASFRTVSPFKPVKIFITAEDEGGVRYPDRKIILSTNNFSIN